jgi:O-antigen/teichoic acid export membrane protein
LAPQISRIAGLFALPIITEYLTPLDFGTYGTISAYIAAFGALQYLGTNVVFSNIFFKSPNHYKLMWRQLHGFLSLWAVVYALLLAVVLYFILPEEVAAVKWLIIGLSVVPAILFEPTLNLTYRYYHLTQQATIIATRTALTGLLTVALNISTIAYLKMGYMGWFWSIFLSNLFSFLLFFYPIYTRHRLTPIFNFKIRTIKSALKISVPALPHYYATYLLKSSDRVVMNIVGINMSSIGLYNIASTFGGYYNSFSDAVGAASAPMYLQLYKEGSKKAFAEARKMTFLVQGFFLLISVGVCIWMKEVFLLLVSNPDLQKAYPLAIVILMSYNYRPMYLGVVNKFMYQEKTNILWKISFVAGVLNVVLNFVFLPLYGITASALITFFTFMYIGYSGYYLKEYKQVQDLDYKPALWFIGTCAALLFSYYFVEAHLLAKAAFSLAVALTCLFLFYRHYIKTGKVSLQMFR